MRIPGILAEEMLAHCRSELPNEGCGLLAGDEQGIHKVYCLANADASPVGYTIDPTGHFEALQDAERNGWDLVGAFHSHVSGSAYPSPTDVRGAAEPDWVWLVAGPMVGSPELRGYRIRDGRITEEELEIAEG